MTEANAPKLTPEQAARLKKMLNLSKYTRRVFFASIILGVIISIVASVIRGDVGSILLIASFGVLLITIVCAVVLFWNVRRIKAYLNSLGIRV